VADIARYIKEEFTSICKYTIKSINLVTTVIKHIYFTYFVFILSDSLPVRLSTKKNRPAKYSEEK
jgi:hypothetical protein